MTPPQAPPDLECLRPRLGPFDLHFLHETPSTSDAAADFLASGRLRPPAVVVTARQTAGRGTRGRSWFSPEAAVAATFLLPIHPDRPIHHLPLLAGLAARDALAGLLPPPAPGRPVELKIKWPNDLQLNGRKLAGLLCERKHGADLLGIGVNVSLAPGEAPEPLRDTIAALHDAHETPADAPDRWAVLAALAAAFAANLLPPDAPTWPARRADWQRHDALLGREVTVHTPTETSHGTAAGVDDQGRLLLTGPGGVRHAIVSGSVMHR